MYEGKTAMTYKTEGRKRISEYLKSTGGGSYTLSELCDTLEPMGLARSSIYRNIKKLVEGGEVTSDPDTHDGRVRYRYAGGVCAHHLHLRCEDCGTLIHLGGEVSHELEQLILDSTGFKINGSIILLGECEKCKSEEKHG